MDLAVLVPDADWEQTVTVLLGRRTQSLGIAPIAFEVIRHPYRDPGVRTDAKSLLRVLVGRANHALACVDFEGSGAPAGPDDLRQDIENQLYPDWGANSAAIVVDPELESWVWSQSAHVGRILGWNDEQSLREYLLASGAWPKDCLKPPDPKSAMEAVMKKTRKRRSPSVYGDLASRVGLRSCTEPSFLRFVDTLREWFPR